VSEHSASFSSAERQGSW